MTAILGVINRNIPCLLGDIMISSPNPPKQNITLPVSGQTSAETPIRWETHYFTDWRQKLVSIGPELMIAWTSNMAIEAVAAVKHLRAGYAESDKSNLDDLLRVVYSIEELDLKHTSIIFLVSNRQGWRMKQFGSGTRIFTTPWGENAVAAGTGEDALIDALATNIEYNYDDAFNQAYGSLMLAGANMWFLDVSGVGPGLAFGGAYELAIKQSNDIVKLDNVLYATFAYNPEKGYGVVPIFKKIDYLDDNLIVRILEFSAPSESEDVEVQIKRSEVFLVPPIDTRWSQDAPPPTYEEVVGRLPDLNATHFALYIKIESVNPEQPHHSVQMQEYRTEDKPIQFNYDEGKNPSSFFMHIRLLEQMEHQIKETLERAGEPICSDHFPLTTSKASKCETQACI